MVEFSESALRSTLLVRFKLTAVDWLTIDRPEQRADIAMHLKPLVNYLEAVSRAAQITRDTAPSGSDLGDDYGSVFASAEALVDRRGRPGAGDTLQRIVIWEAQKKATQRMVDRLPQPMLAERFAQLAAMLAPDSVKARLAKVDKAKDGYIHNADVRVLHQLVMIRTEVAMDLLKLGRLTKPFYSNPELPYIGAFARSIAHSTDELRYTSQLYSALASCALLDRVGLSSGVPSELLQLRDSARAAILSGARVELPASEERTLALPDNLFTELSKANFETQASHACAMMAVGELGSEMFTRHDHAIGMILSRVRELLRRLFPSDKIALRFEQFLWSEEDISNHWDKIKCSTKYSNAAKEGLKARIWASLVVMLRQLARAAITNKKGKYRSIYDQTMACYHSALLLLTQAENSTGAAHLLRFGSHAISQRAAKRYNIV